MGVMRSRDEVAAEQDVAAVAVADGDPIASAMTYAEGVDNALRWVLGHTEDPPASE